ncbi:MAG: hypothetical protein ACXADL_12165, partial [Candidatus Thorarchaeota archaeon]|jgi:hypothetical protein
MAKVELRPFNCPACKDGNFVKIEIDEDIITKAKRLPAMVTTKCAKKHSLVLFVDGNFQVRDIEAAISAASEDKDAIDKTKDWFGSL